MNRKYVIGAVVLCFFSTFVYAQPEIVDEIESESVEMIESPQVITKEEPGDVDNGNVSLDFRDADIKNVFRILALKGGVNIVAGPEVSGVVSIQLNDVPWEEALDVILQTYGYASERKGNIIIVTTVERLKQQRENSLALADQEPLETRTFIVKFGKASEILTSLEKMKTERGSINFDERTNALIITDIPRNIDLMGEVINTLDKTTPQVLIEAKIVETNFSDTENLGVDWITKATASASARPMSWPFKTSTSNVYARDSFPGAEDSDFTYGTLSFTQLQAVFELLKTKSNTNILSNPRIVTLDNQPAEITIGSQYPIPIYTYNQDQGQLQVSGWEYKDIGVIFNVTPHVNSDEFITLDVEPKITAILDYVTVEGTSLPRLSNESTKTSVMIKNAETLVIAGLIKSQTTETKKKVPFLGNVPVFGLAFKKKETSITKTDLIIFITPHIVTPDVSPGI